MASRFQMPAAKDHVQNIAMLDVCIQNHFLRKFSIYKVFLEARKMVKFECQQLLQSGISVVSYTHHPLLLRDPLLF